MLNSPWLDLQGSLLLRTAGTKAIDQIGARRPYLAIPRDVSGFYARSLHRDHEGEWDFDLAWKPLESWPVYAGWLRAVRRGHARAHRGLDVRAPVLVLTSGASGHPKEYDAACTSTDIVLDVAADPAGGRTGSRDHVTLVRVEGAIHDVTLSREPVRPAGVRRDQPLARRVRRLSGPECGGARSARFARFRRMSLSTLPAIAAITEHSAGFAEAARGDLGARVEHCPGWSVADLVSHLTEVHWFWATIVEGPLAAPPEQSAEPARAADADLVDAFVLGAARLVEVLREADQSASCWTWAGWRQDVAFVTRHQVQEAAVHHWDAVHAAGGDPACWTPRCRRTASRSSCTSRWPPTTTRTSRRPRRWRASWPSAPRTPETPGPSRTARVRGRRRSPRGPGRACPPSRRRRPTCCCGSTAGSSWTPASPTTWWPVPRHLLHRLTGPQPARNCTIAATPTTTMNARSAHEGSRLPTVAPIWPPITAADGDQGGDRVSPRGRPGRTPPRPPG